LILRDDIGCIRGETQSQIRTALMAVQERRLAAAEKRRQQKAASNQPGPTSPPSQPRRS
jgi:hypothetical protein